MAEGMDMDNFYTIHDWNSGLDKSYLYEEVIIDKSKEVSKKISSHLFFIIKYEQIKAEKGLLAAKKFEIEENGDIPEEKKTILKDHFESIYKKIVSYLEENNYLENDDSGVFYFDLSEEHTREVLISNIYGEIIELMDNSKKQKFTDILFSNGEQQKNYNYHLVFDLSKDSYGNIEINDIKLLNTDFF